MFGCDSLWVEWEGTLSSRVGIDNTLKYVLPCINFRLVGEANLWPEA